MSAPEASGDQTADKEKTETPASEAAASSNAATVQDSLEDHLRKLQTQLNNSDWLQRNTADDWMNANPEAAAELQKVLAEKRASQNPPQ